MQAGPVASIVLNTANEIAVEAFLKGRIGYLEIPQLIEQFLSRVDFATPKNIDDVIEIERNIRQLEAPAII